MAETNYIVLDLEWNQGSNSTKSSDKLTFEIIEIGAVKMNEEGVMMGEFSQLIKPQVYRKMHQITSQLIHLQMSQLEQGTSFPEACEKFFKWCGEDVMYCTWGPLDLTELQNNMLYHGLDGLAEGPFPFLDVQKLFSIAFEDGKSRKSLEYAVDFLEIEKDIPFHRAFSDAYYTGKVLARIPREFYKNYSFDLFNPPTKREEEVHVQFENYAKYISRIFPNKTAAMADWEVISSKCYICHKNLRKKIKWFTPNGRHYYCVAYCDKHGYMKGKIRIRKLDDDQVFVVKTTKFISEEEMNSIKERKNHAQELKKKRKGGDD